MTISESLKKQLDEASVVYEWMVHQPVYTMEEAARVCDHLPEQGVKVLLVKVEENQALVPSLIVWTGNKKVNFELLAREIAAQNISLATAAEVKDLLGIEVGALTPFGYAQTVPIYFDNNLLSQSAVYINPGVHNASVKLHPKDLLDLIRKWSPEVTLVD